jgi:PAS domain S-box-containing protein
VAGVYRAILGGKGVPGGLLGIALAALAGSFIYYKRARIDSLWKAALCAVAATAFTLPGFLPIGDLAEGWALLKRMALPWGSAVSTGLFVGGLLLWNEERRYDAQQRLADSEREYRQLFESLVDVSYRTDAQGRIGIISPSVERMLGYRPEEILGKPMETLYADPSLRGELDEELEGRGIVDGFEAEFVRKDGSRIVVSTNARAIEDGSGARRGTEGVARDITRAKRAEEKVKTALAEREALISELYHRTNNNMQLISSYMLLQASEHPDGKAADLVRGLSPRIYAMSLVYDKLYKSGNLSRVDMREYIEDLVPSIIEYSGCAEGKIAVILDLERLEFLLDTAIPIGLVLDEIVGNSCKHAFPGDRGGTIRVDLRAGEDGLISLTVSDDGVGMPPGLDPKASSSFGLYSTLSIIRLQMKGAVEVEPSPGVTYRIGFKEGLYEERV